VERVGDSGEVPILVDLWQPGRRDAEGLPRRVRQANTPPSQARESRPPETASGSEAEERSPEEARALMSALQSGWRRGRADDEEGGADR